MSRWFNAALSIAVLVLLFALIIASRRPAYAATDGPCPLTEDYTRPCAAGGSGITVVVDYRDYGPSCVKGDPVQVMDDSGIHTGYHCCFYRAKMKGCTYYLGSTVIGSSYGGLILTKTGESPFLGNCSNAIGSYPLTYFECVIPNPNKGD